MSRLVLKGHSTRCAEVIQLLVMLGAKNQYKGTFKGTFKGFYYWIEDEQVTSSDIPPENSMIFSLEEFEENFPYKVGDKVRVWSQDDDEFFYGSYSYESKTIKSMQWNEIRGKVAYTIEEIDRVFYKEELKPYKEKVNMKENKVNYDIKEGAEKNQPPKTQADVDKYLQEHSVKNGMNVIDIETCLEMDGLKLPENVVINSKGIGSIQFIQWYEKSQYPRDFDECCEVLNLGEDGKLWTKGYKSSLVQSIHQLIICRDAYWKIAGEQMGLDKPWKPKREYDEEIFFIYCDRVNGINKGQGFPTDNFCLSFPTAEMRDVFYENFKDKIKKCKELL